MDFAQLLFFLRDADENDDVEQALGEENGVERDVE